MIGADFYRIAPNPRRLAVELCVPYWPALAIPIDAGHFAVRMEEDHGLAVGDVLDMALRAALESTDPYAPYYSQPSGFDNFQLGMVVTAVDGRDLTLAVGAENVQSLLGSPAGALVEDPGFRAVGAIAELPTPASCRVRIDAMPDLNDSGWYSVALWQRAIFWNGGSGGQRLWLERRGELESVGGSGGGCYYDGGDGDALPAVGTAVQIGFALQAFFTPRQSTPPRALTPASGTWTIERRGGGDSSAVSPDGIALQITPPAGGWPALSFDAFVFNAGAILPSNGRYTTAAIALAQSAAGTWQNIDLNTPFPQGSSLAIVPSPFDQVLRGRGPALKIEYASAVPITGAIIACNVDLAQVAPIYRIWINPDYWVEFDFSRGQPAPYYGLTFANYPQTRLMGPSGQIGRSGDEIAVWGTYPLSPIPRARLAVAVWSEHGDDILNVSVGVQSDFGFLENSNIGNVPSAGLNVERIGQIVASAFAPGSIAFGGSSAAGSLAFDTIEVSRSSGALVAADGSVVFVNDLLSWPAPKWCDWFFRDDVPYYLQINAGGFVPDAGDENAGAWPTFFNGQFLAHDTTTDASTGTWSGRATFAPGISDSYWTVSLTQKSDGSGLTLQLILYANCLTTDLNSAQFILGWSADFPGQSVTIADLQNVTLYPVSDWGTPTPPWAAAATLSISAIEGRPDFATRAMFPLNCAEETEQAVGPATYSLSATIPGIGPQSWNISAAKPSGAAAQLGNTWASVSIGGTASAGGAGKFAGFVVSYNAPAPGAVSWWLSGIGAIADWPAIGSANSVSAQWSDSQGNAATITVTVRRTA